MIRELDFRLTKDRSETKVLSFTNADGSVYDFTGAAVSLKMYLGGSTVAPTSITGTISLADGKVSFPFLAATHTLTEGNFEYLIEEVKAGSTVTLLQGNILVAVQVPFTRSVEAFLLTELPANISLTDNYIQQRKLYWKIILQDAAGISDANLDNDTSWSTLYIMLIAKLIAYDSLELASKGSLMHFMGGSYTDSTNAGGGAIKKIETGPSNVEYHSLSKSIQELFQPNSSGISAWDNLQRTLCGLASKIGIKLPMCKGNKIVVGPLYFQNADWAITSLTTEEDETVISIG